MKIGILQTGHAPDNLRPDLGDYDDMFRKLLHDQGFTFETWNVVDMEFPGDVTDADGWLITGSKHGAYEDHPWIAPLEAFIRDAIEHAVPVVGICFGHQIVAQALGGKVVKFPGGWAVGRQDYDFGGAHLPLNAWHQDQVITPPEGARTIASNDFCAHAALVYGDRALTIQPHPEFGPDFIEGLIHTRGKGVVPQELLDKAESTLDQPLASDIIADQIADFLRKERSA
ncbi:GMP synthase (glutamine-hydrolysing) [Salinihabitans flavidus]|uniref:GMP synthase (Glutamine-hydrolysing) n=1 Tax=Salinihabitans flavidus TaxID=569882 RepID=A0A1H8R998_9RHOB|nr:type 1 glutamine amidotransferase [Salinihabitans flavidus]SEO63149.1 GMP synthase (glutamine-hydrolysing) [Salinihabitans flavidus]